MSREPSYTATVTKVHERLEGNKIRYWEVGQEGGRRRGSERGSEAGGRRGQAIDEGGRGRRKNGIFEKYASAGYF